MLYTEDSGENPGAALRQLRYTGGRRLSQRALATMLGTSRAHIARLELQGSPPLTDEQLDRLEKAALQAKRLAEAKNRELESAWNEFSRIPERAYAIRLELDGIAKLLSELEPGKAEADFKQQYMQMLNGATADGFAQTALAGLLVTRELRKECLNEKAAELNNELSELKARSKALAKKLGQKSNI